MKKMKGVNLPQAGFNASRYRIRAAVVPSPSQVLDAIYLGRYRNPQPTSWVAATEKDNSGDCGRREKEMIIFLRGNPVCFILVSDSSKKSIRKSLRNMEITPNITLHDSDSEIQRFYNGKKVFITGGTGFLGKLLVEKLLRSTNVAAIYFLIRPKKGKSIHTRLDEYFDDVVFQRLKAETPKYKSKIVGIPGDCTLAGLGLSIEDRQLLIENVEIVFHVAATVNFTEKLRLAYSINVKGTEMVLNLCRKMENLRAYIHVSTVYSQSHLKEIDEVFYETVVNYKDLEAILEKLDDGSIERLTPKILGNAPNTYTFTKGLAEALIKDQALGLPVAIFRPAIVISTYKEPMEGWIDNLYGPTGICAGAASGIIRTICCKRDMNANIVPADTCVAAMIVSAWDVAQRSSFRGSGDIPIYNYSSSKENPINWGEFLMINKLWAELNPPSNSLWTVLFDTSESTVVYTIRKVLYHTIPGALIDFLSLLGGRKPRMIKLYFKVHKFLDVLSYFSSKEWKCNNDNVVKLWCKMSPRDKEIYPFSMATVHWTVYFKSYMLGIRKYLLKDSEQTLTKAKKRRLRMKVLHNVVMIVIAFTIFNIFSHVMWRTIGNFKPFELESHFHDPDFAFVPIGDCPSQNVICKMSRITKNCPKPYNIHEVNKKILKKPRDRFEFECLGYKNKYRDENFKIYENKRHQFLASARKYHEMNKITLLTTRSKLEDAYETLDFSFLEEIPEEDLLNNEKYESTGRLIRKRTERLFNKQPEIDHCITCFAEPWFRRYLMLDKFIQLVRAVICYGRLMKNLEKFRLLDEEKILQYETTKKQCNNVSYSKIFDQFL
ncbi:hypothetical protein Trydic_g10175 [Trypoxylus dichotomus]